jgi:hypothetical protein
VGHHSGGSNSATENIRSNLEKLKRQFGISQNGNFGKKGRGRSRVIQSADADETAASFWSRFSSGGSVFKISDGVIGVRFPDGSFATFRPKTSSPGSPAITISLEGAVSGVNPRQKIHFENDM